MKAGALLALVVAEEVARKRIERAAKSRAKSKAARTQARAAWEASGAAPDVRPTGHKIPGRGAPAGSPLDVVGTCTCGGRILRARRHLGMCRGGAGCVCPFGSELCERCHQPAPRGDDIRPEARVLHSPEAMAGQAPHQQASRKLGGLRAGGRKKKAGRA